MILRTSPASIHRWLGIKTLFASDTLKLIEDEGKAREARIWWAALAPLNTERGGPNDAA